MKGSNPELEIVSSFLRESLPFDELPEDVFDTLPAKIEIIYYQKGHVFSGAENETGLRIIRSGAIELHGENGQLIDRLGEGESFNLKGLRREQPELQAVLIEDSLLYQLREADYQTIRRSNRDFDRFFHSQRDRRIRRAVRVESNPSHLLRPIADVMTVDVLSISPYVSIQEAAHAMSIARVSSILIQDRNQLVGILTDRDLRTRAVAKGVDLSLPVSNIMTEDPRCLGPHETLFDATLFMARSGFHHIPLLDSSGHVAGIVTSSDLMLAKQDDPVFIVQHISRKNTLDGLIRITQTLPNLLLQWVNMGIRAQQISHLLTAISDAVTQNLIALFIQKEGDPPVPFCWLAFGSQARGEQLLGADQDNGLLISNDMKETDKSWFEKLSIFVCDGLNACGYVYCPGKVMASNPDWRQSLSGWEKTVSSWTEQPTADALMRVSIFFDIRAVYGDQSLGQCLQKYMLNKAASSSIFLAGLAENVLSTKLPLGLFRQFVVDHQGEHKDELNLKKTGVVPVVDTARIFSLAHGITAVNTQDRLQAVLDRKMLGLTSVRNLQDAFSFIMQVRIEQQAQQIASGLAPSNYVNPDSLTKVIRRQLKDAFTVLADGQLAVKMHFRPEV